LPAGKKTLSLRYSPTQHGIWLAITGDLKRIERGLCGALPLKEAD